MSAAVSVNLNLDLSDVTFYLLVSTQAKGVPWIPPPGLVINYIDSDSFHRESIE